MLLVQRPTRLTIGDTHEYAEPFASIWRRTPTITLRARARPCSARPSPSAAPLGGVYSEMNPAVAGHALYHRAEAEPGVILVTGREAAA